MSLQTRAVLVKLKICQYDGFKKDIRVADDVDERYHTSGSAGNYNKRLFNKATLKPIQKIANRLRADHTKLTIPYTYEGIGILTKDIYFEYTSMVREHKDAFEDAVNNFVQQYPVYIADRRSQLGDLFVEEDYPDAEVMRKKFAIETHFSPVPSENHFDNEFSNDANEEIRKSFMADMRDTQQEAVNALYSRVRIVLQHLNDKISDPDTVFRNSTVDNVTGMIDLLPKLNIFDDERLTKTHEQMVELLGSLTAEDLRIDMALRRRTVNDTFDILNLLQGGEANGTGSN
jgi:hypothetical protein